MKPTIEQQAVVDANGKVIKAIAFAGAGKTSTFVERAKAHVKRTLYLCFNKSVQVEAEKRFPKHVTCKTQHGLAYQAIIVRRGHKGIQYTNVGKLFLKPTAQRFRIDYYMVSLVHKTVENFCNSADAEMIKAHVEPDVIGRYTYDVSDTVLKYAKEVWNLMISGNDQQSFPMTHGGYLKLFQLSKPRLGYDVIMLDEAQDTNPVVHDIVLSQADYGSQIILTGDPYQQIYCQPAGANVLLVGKPGNGKTGQADYYTSPIEQVKVGDMVVSYDISSGYAHKNGSRVTRVGTRKFDGQVVTVTAGEPDEPTSSRYTHDHHCVVRIGDAFVGKHVVYLMRRGHSYRLGRTTWRSYSQNSQLGCMFRARQEDADAWWVVSVCDTKQEAAAEELALSWKFSVPTVTFNASKSHIIGQDGLDMFWANVGDNSADAAALLEECGKDIKYPLWSKGNGNLLVRRPLIVAAANMEIGMEVLLADRVVNSGGNRIPKTAWSRITWVDTEKFTGDVFSLEVENTHTYFADGILTHNCWRGAVDALNKVEAETHYMTQSFRFGPEVAGVANVLLNTFFNETRPLVGLGAAGKISGLGKHMADEQNVSADEQLPECYTFLARTNAFLFAEASRRAGTCKMFVPGSGANGELPIFQAVLDVFALYQGRKMDIKGDFDLRHFDDYWQFLDFVKTGMADPEWTISAAMIEKYKEGIPAQIEKIRKSLVSRPEDAQVTLITAHRAKGMEWDNVVLGDDYAELFDENGQLRPLGDDRKTQVAHDEINLLYVAATRAKKHLTLNAQLAQLLAYRQANTAASADAAAESEALEIESTHA